MSNRIKIALADDECLLLEGLSLLFSAVGTIRVVFTATDGNDFLEQLHNLPAGEFPNVVLLDIQMKPIDGFELVQRLKKEYPDLSVIILSSHYKSAVFGHMIRLGVSAFLPKNSSKELLVEAIEKVYNAGVFFTEKDHAMLASIVKNKLPKQYFSTSGNLSEREIDVLKLICSEKTNQEIADQLFLSKRTIESHRQRILDKIGAKNTAGLVIYAISNELYTPDSKYYS